MGLAWQRVRPGSPVGGARWLAYPRARAVGSYGAAASLQLAEPVSVPLMTSVRRMSDETVDNKWTVDCRSPITAQRQHRSQVSRPGGRGIPESATVCSVPGSRSDRAAYPGVAGVGDVAVCVFQPARNATWWCPWTRPALCLDRAGYRDCSGSDTAAVFGRDRRRRRCGHVRRDFLPPDRACCSGIGGRSRLRAVSRFSSRPSIPRAGRRVGARGWAFARGAGVTRRYPGRRISHADRRTSPAGADADVESGM